MKTRLEYISIGGNRHPSASDYNSFRGILAFGAGHGVALWKPLNSQDEGIHCILNGHSGDVNAVRFIPTGPSHRQILLSASSDKTIRIWTEDLSQNGSFVCTSVIEAHSASINCITCLNKGGAFASGAADGTVKIWTKSTDDHAARFELASTINLQPKCFPLTLSWHELSDGASIIVVGGTRSTIQVYTCTDDAQAAFKFAATLTGHEGWIRSIDIIRESHSAASDLIIASASQDKYIRLWRVHQGSELPKLADQDDGSRLGSIERSLSSKAQTFEVAGSNYTLSFEALLLGHEDWVYTAYWDKQSTTLRLLSASADSSLSLWEPEPVSGIWICSTRLGEISVQKGSTTATGSAGGFFSGLWLNKAKAVACLGRTGSWRIWSQPTEDGPWKPKLGISGHISHTRGVAWAKDGSYVLSTSSDQTTRVHAEWKKEAKRSWHEFARPQIHGYDLNCIDSINALQFISGADEKLLRVFDEPSGSSLLLQNLSGAQRNIDPQAHEAASIPVLGLSNKAVEICDDLEGDMNGDITQRELAAPTVPIIATDHPPYEDDLARHTLWPEKEKLYGHGYEISAVAASHDGKLVATACKASSIDHAVIRLYETTTWRELSPPLKAHSLTVTCLRFSVEDQYLLSVGRDRQWTVFIRDTNESFEYRLFAADPKGHSRMILGAAWAPEIKEAGSIFATAGRDKSIKLWTIETGSAIECKSTIQAASPVMTVDFLPEVIQDHLLLASGTEAGIVTLTSVSTKDWTCLSSQDIDASLLSAAPISQVAWQRQVANSTAQKSHLLAVASEDHSVKIFSIAE